MNTTLKEISELGFVEVFKEEDVENLLLIFELYGRKDLKTCSFSPHIKGQLFYWRFSDCFLLQYTSKDTLIKEGIQEFTMQQMLEL